MQKILFVNPFYLRESVLEQNLMTLYFPLGLLYLAGAAREAGYEVAVFDATFASSEVDFETMLVRFRPDVICVASLVTWRATALRLARLSKKQNNHVIFGGPDPTLVPEAYLGDPAVDYVVAGEGERTLVMLIQALGESHDVANVQGIVRRSDSDQDDLITTPPQDPILDLDALAWPARDLIDVNAYLERWEYAHGYRSISLSVSRGCPYGCEFCSGSVMGPHLRRRSPVGVVAEMQALERQYAIDRFRIVDDLEGLGHTWLESLSREMQAAGITTPFEGLRPVNISEVPMLDEVKDICSDRNKWIPTQAPHPHAPPELDLDLIDRRWREGRLLGEEHLEDP